MFPISEEQSAYLQQRLQKDQKLLDAIKIRLPELERLRLDFTVMYEDGVYRFYHHSFKVYSLQGTTLRAVEIFRSIAEETGNKLCEWFEQILADGTRVGTGSQRKLAAAYSADCGSLSSHKVLLGNDGQVRKRIGIGASNVA